MANQDDMAPAYYEVNWGCTLTASEAAAELGVDASHIRTTAGNHMKREGLSDQALCVYMCRGRRILRMPRPADLAARYPRIRHLYCLEVLEDEQATEPEPVAIPVENAVPAVREPEPEPVENPCATTIEWERFAYDEGGVSGISLRAMVEAGLYSVFGNAVASLRESDLAFSVTAESSSSDSRRGPAPRDYILSLRDAQRFAMRARTSMGNRIAELILDHHDEFQRLLSGDQAAHARMRHAQGLDRLGLVDEVREAFGLVAARVAEQTQRLEQLEQRLDTSMHDGECTAMELARELGWYTERGNPHGGAIHLVRRNQECREGLHFRTLCTYDEQAGPVDRYVYTAAFARLLREEWAPDLEGEATRVEGTNYFYIRNLAGGSGAHVYRGLPRPHRTGGQA